MCFDLGGTKLVGALVDVGAGRVLDESRVATPVDNGARGSLEEILRLGRLVLDKAERSGSAVSGVGVSFGGPISHDRQTIVRSMHVSDWDNHPLPAWLAGEFSLPAAMENDANAAVLAEAAYGAGRGQQNVIYVQLSTGVGAGLLLGGHLYRGRGAAGEFGHMVLEQDGPVCSCGNRGCLESIASGWALAVEGRKVSARYLNAEVLSEAARAGDRAARTILGRAGRGLGIAIANAINLLDPDVVVVGGGLTGAWDILESAVSETLSAHVFPHLYDPRRVVRSSLADHAPLLGAAIAIDHAVEARGIL